MRAIETYRGEKHLDTALRSSNVKSQGKPLNPQKIQGRKESSGQKSQSTALDLGLSG